VSRSFVVALGVLLVFALGLLVIVDSVIENLQTYRP